MTFPIGTTISTANVASADSDPSLARSDFFSLITAFNQLVSSVNQVYGAAVLDGNAQIPTANLPTTMNMTGTLTLTPSTGIVNVRNVLRLYTMFADDLGTVLGTTSNSAGDIVYLTDGDGGRPCLGVYDGTNWRVVRMGTTVGSVAAALTSTATLTAEANA